MTDYLEMKIMWRDLACRIFLNLIVQHVDDRPFEFYHAQGGNIYLIGDEEHIPWIENDFAKEIEPGDQIVEDFL